MGLIKLCKMFCEKFTCNSKCSFNDENFDFEIHNTKINDYILKNKDVMRIQRILSKRKKSIKPTNNSNNVLTEI